MADRPAIMGCSGGGGQGVRRSGGQVAHEALELHVALGEPDVARGNVRALGVRVALGDT